MATCDFPGCPRPRHTDEQGHADDNFCLGHSGEVRRGVPVRDVEAGPYRSLDTGVYGPHVLGISMPIADPVTLASLLNLVYASGKHKAAEEALERIEREEVAREMGRIERRQSDAADDKCDRMRGN